MPKKTLYLGLDPTRFQSNNQLIHWPIIKIVSTSPSNKKIERAFQQFHHFTHLIFTSRTTVSLFPSFLSFYQIPFSSWQSKFSMAIGQATAEKLRELNIEPYLISKEEHAEGLIKELLQFEWTDLDFFFLPQSALARPILRLALEQMPVRFECCSLYHPVVNEPLLKIDLLDFDEIIFTSPSTLDAFLKVFKKFPPSIKLTTLGPITAKHLEHLLN
jgi:uroporphyrinogen-III synthase